MSKIAIIYWTGTGNTESMANLIADGIKDVGKEVEIFSVDQFDTEAIEKYDSFAFGCPSMGDEILEEDEFEPFFSDIESKLTDKKVALFGSYGWGDGEWMRDWEERARGVNAKLFEEGLIINEAPEDEDALACVEFGKRFAR